ncbi:hypothetical protein GCM10023093_24080 [Nemorincola caseinilytica]|uniref:Outer membrane protein beta-barrel domain-containing protein n=1 Tax=Nemorincola caseinilytica TaxID=2054315 RepID=A0ABP8NK94_9BACT
MKKLTLAALSCLALSATAQTTEKKPKNEVTAYAKIGIGYGFVSSGIVSTYNGSERVTPTMRTIDMKPASFTAGQSAEISVGALFGRHVGAELRAYIVTGTPEYTYVTEGFVSSGGITMYDKETVTTRARTPMVLMPSMVVQSGGEKVNIYSRFGLAIPLSNKIDIKDDYEVAGNPFRGHAEYEMTSKMKLGFTGAAGVSFKAGNKIRIWVEANMLSLSPIMDEMVLTKYTVNGVNELANVSARNKRVNFDLSGQEAFPLNEDKPAMSIAEALPYSNAGLSAGISMSF